VTRFATMTTAGALALGLATATAQAVPLAGSAAGLNAAVNETGLITHVDACNRVCRKGPVEEWGGAVAMASPCHQDLPAGEVHTLTEVNLRSRGRWKAARSGLLNGDLQYGIGRRRPSAR
jgi:hypothetical protein